MTQSGVKMEIEMAALLNASNDNFRSIVSKFVTWIEYRQAYSALNQLSDHTLRDIGLHRSQIRGYVLERLDAKNSNDEKAA